MGQSDRQRNVPIRVNEGNKEWLDRDASISAEQIRKAIGAYKGIMTPTDLSAKEGQQGFTTKTRSILFMDVTGWSKLSAYEIYSYATRGLDALSKLLFDFDFVNTWGDAIVATFDSAKSAAENALRIQEFFRNSYPESGVAPGLSCRISLHLGEVISCDNAVRKSKDIFGEAVHIAARLEPVTIPGSVYCTQPFADRLQEVSGSAPKPWPIGNLALAKGFGTAQIWIISGPNAPDPRRTYDIALQESGVFSPSNRDIMPDSSAVLRVKGWLNKLPKERSGEAISLEEIDRVCNLVEGQTFRVLRDAVSANLGYWQIDEITPHDVILLFRSST